jgi:hypothetical protein
MFSKKAPATGSSMPDTRHFWKDLARDVLLFIEPLPAPRTENEWIAARLLERARVIGREHMISR